MGRSVSPVLARSFLVLTPATLADGDQPITATYEGVSTQAGTLIAIQH